jgi:hypothetical protein
VSLPATVQTLSAAKELMMMSVVRLPVPEKRTSLQVPA